MLPAKWLNIVGVALLALVALGLRLVNIKTQPLWADEIFGLGVVKTFSSIAEIINYLKAAEVYPPLYHIYLFYWTNWFGFSELAVRSLVVVAGVAVVVLVWDLTRRLFDDKQLAYVAGGLVALMPIQIYFSQVVRPYMFFTVMALLMTLAYWQRLQTQRRVYSLLMILWSVVGLYLHYSYVFILAPLLGFWIIEALISRRPGLRAEIWEWLAINCAIFLAFYPWLSTFFYKLTLAQFSLYGLGRGSLIPERAVSFIESSVNALVWTTSGASAHTIEVLAVVLFKIMFIALFFYTVINTDAWRQTAQKNKTAIALVTTLALTPVILFMISPYSFAYTIVPEQHILPASIFLIIFVSFIIWQFVGKWRWIVLLMLVVSMLNYSFKILQNEANWNAQYRVKEMAEFVNAIAEPNDMVVTGYAIFRTDFNFYLREDLETIAFYPTNYYGGDELASRLTLGIFENEMHFRIGVPTPNEQAERWERLIKIHQPQRIWLVYFPWTTEADVWLRQNGWTRKIGATGKLRTLMPFDLYVKK